MCSFRPSIFALSRVQVEQKQQKTHLLDTTLLMPFLRTPLRSNQTKNSSKNVRKDSKEASNESKKEQAPPSKKERSVKGSRGRVIVMYSSCAKKFEKKNYHLKS